MKKQICIVSIFLLMFSFICLSSCSQVTDDSVSTIESEDELEHESMGQYAREAYTTIKVIQ